MCTVEQLSKALKENNNVRDKNLENKLHEVKVELKEHVSETVSNIKMTPEAAEKVRDIQMNCLKVSAKQNKGQELMQKDIDEIITYIKEDKEWKEKTWEKIDERFVTKEELKPVKEKVARVMGVIWGLLIACGVIIAYYFLVHIGLPTP